MGMTISYVYRLTNKVNNKIYIGKSNNPYERLIRHFSTAKTKYNKKHRYQLVHKAINKHGKVNFTLDILETCNSSSEALEREKYWIKELSSNDMKFGYNLTSGGDGGCSKETAIKISKTLTNRIVNLNGLLNRLYKLFSFLPNYKKEILANGHELNRRERVQRAQIILNEYFNNKNITYDLLDPNKQLNNDLKQDVLNLFKHKDIGVIDISIYFNLSKKQIIYIISRYKNGFKSEEQKRLNRSNGRKGKKHTEESKRKISESNTGKTIDQYSRNKISIANSGENNGMHGRTHSQETKDKMSKFQSTRIRKPLTEEHKQKCSEASKNQDFSFRIPLETKKEIIELYASGNFTKNQLAEKFQLKYNSICTIIRTDNERIKKHLNNILREKII